MAYDWGGSLLIKVNVVEWPSFSRLQGGRERVDWLLETLDDAVSRADLADGIQSIRPSLQGGVLDVELSAVGDGSLNCAFEYSAESLVSARVLAASRVWRLIDEGVARLWRLNDLPRVNIPEFMRQRRQLVERISADLWNFWMCSSLVRVEPLWSFYAGQPSVAHELIEYLGFGGSAAQFTEAVRRRIKLLCESSQRGPSGVFIQRFGAPHGQEVARLANRAREGFEEASLHAVCGCTEEVFEFFFSVDAGEGGPRGIWLSRLEDRMWWSDLEDLSGDGPQAQASIAERMALGVGAVTEFIGAPS